MARLHSFTADQRADIEGMMKNLGYGFEKATGQLQKEHALVETSTDPGASLHTLIVPALRSIRADADYWQRACARMNAAYRSIPALDKDFERATGVAASVGTVGSFAAASLKAQVTLSTKPLQQALDDAERAGSHIAAELSGAIGCANAIYRRFGEQYSSYVEASRRLECATAQFDGAEVKEARAEVEKLDRAMKQTMSEFLPLADKLRAKGREFDKSVRKAVVDLSVSGASLAANGIAKPIETVWEGAAEAVLGGAIESPIAEEVHHAVERLSE